MFPPWVVEEEIKSRYHEKVQAAEALRRYQEHGNYYSTWIHAPLLQSFKSAVIAVGQKFKARKQSVSSASIPQVE
jgi:hypothetical protein